MVGISAPIGPVLHQVKADYSDARSKRFDVGKLQQSSSSKTLQGPAFDKHKMQRLIEYSCHDIRAQLYELFKEPVFQLHYGETLAQERERCVARWQRISSLGIMKNTISSGTAEGRARYDAVMETCGILDHSLDIKMGVHYGLFGATVAMMGSDEQAKEWLPKIEDCTVLGCFSLSELGHGSNARGILTEARYNPSKQSFTIHTPSEDAQKYWIGGAYQTARWTAAFAQLYIGEKCFGIHPFLVRIRNDDGSPVKGITLADCGHKCGLNGVDNGRIWFEHVEIPRTQLLCKYNRVEPDGTYKSKFKTADERFGAAMGSLSGGRVSIASCGVNQAKLGLAIAIRYSNSRRAFGADGEQETRLIDYQSQQVRLFPQLAATYVFQFVVNELKKKWHQTVAANKELHVWSSGFKALMTWHMAETLQECREACGGQGYKSENKIGWIKNEHDISVTFEGDNHILLFQVARAILGDFSKGLRNMGHFRGNLSYLNDRHGLRNADVDSMKVTSREFATTVMRRREAALLARMSRYLQRSIASGLAPLDAWNANQILAEELARAHTERLIVEIFHGCIDARIQEGDTGIAEILKLCGELYALRRIDTQPVFLRLRALSPMKAEAVHDEILRLCEALRPHAIDLVDAFGIPGHLLAPIAFDWVAHNSRAKL